MLVLIGKGRPLIDPNHSQKLTGMLGGTFAQYAAIDETGTEES